ncbi:MAG: (Fe-S)-binding protein [candidate division Zixibacteria bacterium]|nr:(Fe-S)-binding protein [candidate division Zixibacteria bacterium]
MVVERIILTVAILAGLYLFVQPVWFRLRRIHATTRGFRVDQIGRRIGRFISEVLLQDKIIVQRPFAGTMHALVFWGFLAFIPVTIDHFVRGYGGTFLGHGTLRFLVTSAVAVLAVAVIIGITGLALRRYIARPAALGAIKLESGVVAMFIEILMVTYLLDLYVFTDPTTAAARVNWWVHALTILAFMALIPRSKHLHLVLSPVTTFLKDLELAKISPLNFEKEEFGAVKLSDLSAHTALGAFTCVECGRCYDNCPARSTGKLLDPKKLMLDLRDGFLKDPSQLIVGQTIEEEILWQCTTCGACTYQCPVGIDQVVPILETRRGMTAEGKVPHTFNTFFGNLERLQNPWAYPTPQAHEFIEKNNYPKYDGHEWLYWMGCLARFDVQYQKVSLAFKQILDSAGVSYGVLPDEQCTGDAARRAGNEYLFTELANANIEMLKAAGVKRIVATCPHCVRTISEYKDFGLDADVQVIHHARLIDDLIATRKLSLDGRPAADKAAKVVYHDPCYLSRYGQPGDITKPRTILHQALGTSALEPERTREKSFCCGAGGAMIFAEETKGKRVNRERTEELLRTDANQIAVACPFCQIMVRDATNDLGRGDNVQVRDIAQFVADRMT